MRHVGDVTDRSFYKDQKYYKYGSAIQHISDRCWYSRTSWMEWDYQLKRIYLDEWRNDE